MTCPAIALNLGAPALLGDIVIAAETVTREAESLQIPVADHLMHLFVHGMLHLFGYDHIDDDMAETMESLEINFWRILVSPTLIKIRNWRLITNGGFAW